MKTVFILVGLLVGHDNYVFTEIYQTKEQCESKLEHYANMAERRSDPSWIRDFAGRIARKSAPPPSSNQFQA